MKWKEYKAKPIFPRRQMQTTILHKQELVPEQGHPGKTIVQTENGKLSCWDSQVEKLATIMEKHDYKKDITVLWIEDPINPKYVIPKEVTENIT